MAISAGAALLSTAVTWATGGALIGASLLTHFAVSTALGAALNALSPNPSSAADSSTQGYETNTLGSASDAAIIYGQVKVGGVIVYDESTGTDNKFLHRVIALAGHEVHEGSTVYLDDEELTYNGSTGEVSNPSKYNGKLWVKVHTGSPTQTADADLVADSNVWTSSHKLSNIAYLYVKLAFDTEVFPNGVPTFTALVKGKKLYNPRTEAYEFSDNPALALNDYLLSEYGLGDEEGNVDQAKLISSADLCDGLINGKKRYTLNGTFTTSGVPADIITGMLTAMGGTLWYAQGKWRMKPAYWTEPVMYIDENDLRSSISVSTRHSRRDNFNTIKGTFRGDETNWQTTDYPQVSNTAFVSADNGQVSTADVPLPYTDNSVEAKRHARIALERNRQQLTVSASFGLRTMKVQVGDNLWLTNSRFGWAAKEFEVIQWTFGLVDGLDLQTTLTLRETAESIFDENDDGVVYERDNTRLLDPFEVPVPSLDAAIVTTTIQDDGTSVPSLEFNWSVTAPEAVDYYDFQWKLTSASKYESVNQKETKYVIDIARSGAAYDYRVRAVNVFGIKSIFVNAPSPISTGVDGTIPNAPTSLTSNGSYGGGSISWVAPTNNTDGSALKDLFQYKVYRGTSSSPTTLVGRAAGEIFVDSGLSHDTRYYYRVKAIDFTGNESSYSANVNFTTEVQALDGSDGADGTDGSDGARGAGRWNIGVTTLPTSSSGANVAFSAVFGSSFKVDRDQAWFYTGSQSSPTSQSVWIYNLDINTWIEQTEVIDGNLLVSGTITASRLESTVISTLGLTIGNLSSAASGARLQFKDDVIKVYDSSGTVRVKIGDLS